MINIFDLYTTLKREGVIFSFCGPASQEVVEGIGETLRRRMELEGVGAGVVNRVFAVFIEQIHNILHYSEEIMPEDGSSDYELRFGIVLVGTQGTSYYVSCGNFISNRDVSRLKDLLEMLRGMDKDQLKAFYKERRRREPDETSKGGGIGFIEMARKAGEPLEFEITPVDEETSFFSMTARI